MIDKPFFVSKETFHKEKNLFKIDVVEFDNFDFPFEAERVYVLTTNSKSNFSGNHAHLNQSQILFLINGSATLKLTNLNKDTFEFDLGESGVYVPAKHWIELHINPHSSVLCIASKSYKKLNSVKNFQDFINLKS